MRRSVSVLGLATVLAAAAMGASLTGSLTASAAGGTSAAKAKLSSGPGKWVQLSSGKGVGNTADPSVHRFGKSLQVVWVQAGSMAELHTRVLAASGAPASADDTLLRWSSLNETPAITSHGKERLIAFSGIDGASGSGYDGGYGYYETSTNGTKWTPAKGTLGSDPSVYDTTGEDVADAAGTPVVVYPAVAAGGVSYRRGFDTLPPTTSRDASTASAPCCAYYPGVGYDAKSGQTWTAWYSNSGKAASDGISAERIFPSAGSLVHAPSSSVKSSGAYSSVEPEERTQVAARRGGGLYTAYGIGYPDQTKVALWKLGSSKPLVVNVGQDIAFPGIAAAPSGRLWLFWWVRNTSTLYAARTNTAGSKLGAIRRVATPHGTTTVWKTAGDGGNGRLDLVVNATVGSSEELFATQVLPGLSGRVSPGAVTSSHGGKVTVTVTDAGDVVKGAQVRYDGKSKKTNSHGQVVFTIAKGSSKGARALSFSHSGYAGGTLHIRVN